MNLRPPDRFVQLMEEIATVRHALSDARDQSAQAEYEARRQAQAFHDRAVLRIGADGFTDQQQADLHQALGGLTAAIDRAK